MNQEKIPLVEKTLNDFYVQCEFFMSKWTSEGNKDIEKILVDSLKQEVASRVITPLEGIVRLQGIDHSRIER